MKEKNFEKDRWIFFAKILNSVTSMFDQIINAQSLYFFFFSQLKTFSVSIVVYFS